MVVRMVGQEDPPFKCVLSTPSLQARRSWGCFAVLFPEPLRRTFITRIPVSLIHSAGHHQYNPLEWDELCWLKKVEWTTMYVLMKMIRKETHLTYHSFASLGKKMSSWRSCKTLEHVSLTYICNVLNKSTHFKSSLLVKWMIRIFWHLFNSFLKAKLSNHFHKLTTS